MFGGNYAFFFSDVTLTFTQRQNIINPCVVFGLLDLFLMVNIKMVHDSLFFIMDSLSLFFIIFFLQMM